MKEDQGDSGMIFDEQVFLESSDFSEIPLDDSMQEGVSAAHGEAGADEGDDTNIFIEVDDVVDALFS